MTRAKGQRLIRALLIANTLFWVLFWGYCYWASEPTPALLSSQPGPIYHSHPNYVSFLGRGLPDGFPKPVKTATLVQLPSLAISAGLAQFLPGEFLFAGTNQPGFRLLGTTLLSFVQWYLVGLAIGWLVSRRGSPKQVPAR